MTIIDLTNRVGRQCPRCYSRNTKFCYYNNYSINQPRYYCNTCHRYWTVGGTIRPIPFGGSSRKNKRTTTNTNTRLRTTAPPSPPPQPQPGLMIPANYEAPQIVGDGGFYAPATDAFNFGLFLPTFDGFGFGAFELPNLLPPTTGGPGVVVGAGVGVGAGAGVAGGVEQPDFGSDMWLDFLRGDFM